MLNFLCLSANIETCISGISITNFCCCKCVDWEAPLPDFKRVMSREWDMDIFWFIFLSYSTISHMICIKISKAIRDKTNKKIQLQKLIIYIQYNKTPFVSRPFQKAWIPRRLLEKQGSKAPTALQGSWRGTCLMWLREAKQLHTPD